ncbi:ABC transporter permease [Gimesia maris]|uniref:Sulfate transport system permease protein CysW n=2 Tax=Gimesia maris TaxID=122 RepID=A0ABX5YLV3_9PLAN|nr:ABC transporter permease [Gimesia maris]EDL59833.1 ABC-type molybdate transport system, permease component [Gimesia maris DSM 8797]QEG16679.1 Sulfate transport system permease protein CysW [Gimesia maris]
MTEPSTNEQKIREFKPRSDLAFYTIFISISAFYVFLIVAMLTAETTYTTPDHIWKAFAKPEIRYAIWLSLISCAITTVLSLWVSVPIGYLMSRHEFPGKTLIDAILDIPIVLPPLVIGLCLLILFQVEIPQIEWLNRMVAEKSGVEYLPSASTAQTDSVDDVIRKVTKVIFGKSIGVTYEIPSVILAQFMVACAFAVRTMRVTFDQIGPRYEQVALTLGCSRGQAFWRVVFPQAYRGLLAAGTLAWARSLGEFGPILVFSGATRMKTEVLPTTVFLELTVGNIEGAVAASLIMVVAALIVLVIARMFGLTRGAAI